MWAAVYGDCLLLFGLLFVFGLFFVFVRRRRHFVIGFCPGGFLQALFSRRVRAF